MGFRDLQCFNKALPSKSVWRANPPTLADLIKVQETLAQNQTDMTAAQKRLFDHLRVLTDKLTDKEKRKEKANPEVMHKLKYGYIKYYVSFVA